MEEKSENNENACKLNHKRQILATGCTAHTLFALTGHEGWLEYEDETSAFRWYCIIAQHGVFFYPLWAGGVGTLEPMPSRVWDEFARTINGPVGVSAVVRMGHILHSVAIQVPSLWSGSVWVSDSLQDQVLEFTTREQFMQSIYAEPVKLSVLGELRLEAYQK
jgi:hypothetical protein